MALEQIIVRLNPDVPPSGTDLSVVNAARRSFGKRTEVFEKRDENLIKFLARGIQTKDFDNFVEELQHQSSFSKQFPEAHEAVVDLLWQWRHTPTHDTPFNHCHISFEIKAPIFVARQLVKTEYAPFSEFSRRYITEDVEFYEHDYRNASEDKKQGSFGEHVLNEHYQLLSKQHNQNQLDLYNQMIDDKVAPEQARGVLPQDLMTSWTWSATLGAFAKMCRERMASDTQLETRYVANKVYDHMYNHFPISTQALVKGC